MEPKSTIQQTTKANFWNFKNKRIYSTRNEKIWDAIHAFFLAALAKVVLNLIVVAGYSILRPDRDAETLDALTGGFFIILLFLFIIYLWRRRKFFAYGLIPAIFLPF